MKRIRLLLAIFCVGSHTSAQFLKTSGQRIVDDNGKEIQLRGLGLGGWMLQEGYMLKTADFAGTQHSIKQKIAEVAGKKGMEDFYKAYLKNGITKKDIDSLAKWGFNSVRLPMHYNLYTLSIEDEPVKGQNTWLEEGFRMTDDLLKWCEANRMYLFLDLHAVPGGQGKDANISDYDPSKPSVWESEENKAKTAALWKKLAERYRNSPWIGGYDIINEPNWNFTGTHPNGCDEKSNAPLRDLQIRITKAIREVDQKHIIIIEGNCWGNNYEGMFPLWDENMVLSFHKYWNMNTPQAISGMTSLREKYNVPVWLGESGENSNVWFTEAISLMESNHIGWAFWPMKKVDNIAGICNVKMNPDYAKLLDYWKNGGTKPSEKLAKKALMQLAEDYKIENTEIRRDVMDAMFRQVHSDATLPFASNRIPGYIPATAYDLGKNGSAYYDRDTANYRIDTGIDVVWNSGNQLRNDGVDIFWNKADGFYVGKTEAGEWLKYTLDVSKNKDYILLLDYRNDSSQVKNISVSVNGQEKILQLEPGRNVFQNQHLENIPLHKGKNIVVLKIMDEEILLKGFSIQ